MKYYRKSSCCNSYVSPNNGLKGFPNRFQLEANALTANAATYCKNSFYNYYLHKMKYVYLRKSFKSSIAQQKGLPLLLLQGKTFHFKI